MKAADSFTWIVEGKIGGMPKPDIFGTLEENLELLEKNFGVGIIMTLTEESLDAELVENYGFEYYHMPIENFCPPTLEQLQQIMKIYQNSSKAIAVHCFAGVGRTGTVLAAMLVLEGMNSEEAISFVRDKRPGSIETIKQEDAVFMFEDFLKK